jgi:hypothetical protein
MSVAPGPFSIDPAASVNIASRDFDSGPVQQSRIRHRHPLDLVRVTWQGKEAVSPTR